MQGSTHFVTGFTTGLGVALILGETEPVQLTLCAGVAGVASLVPDWLQINVPGVKQIKGLFGHRGFSHWLWTALAAAAAMWPLGLGPYVLAGWVCHLLLDAMSDGVPLLWPFGRITAGHIKTGSEIDTLIGSFSLILAVAVGIRVVLGGGIP